MLYVENHDQIINYVLEPPTVLLRDKKMFVVQTFKYECFWESPTVRINRSFFVPTHHRHRPIPVEAIFSSLCLLHSIYLSTPILRNCQENA